MTENTPTSLYKYYDRDGILIYVGITSRGMQRNSEHNTSKSWWQYVNHQTVEHHRTRASALHRESEIIRKFAPPFNKQQNPDFKAAQDAYLIRQSLGGMDGAQVLTEGRNRIPGLIANRVANRVTILVPDTRVVFDADSQVRIDSGGRNAKLLDSGEFADGSGNWAMIHTVKAEQVTGAIVMYRNLNDDYWPVKMIKVIYQNDGLLEVGDLRKNRGA